MKIHVDDRKIAWLEGNNISFHNRFGGVRLKAGDTLSFRDNTEIEPYIGIHGGFNIPVMGFMSYSNSVLPEDIVIGRYCSLAWAIDFPRYRHPIEHVSSSIFTHDKPTDLVARAIRDQNPGYDNFHVNQQKGRITIEHDVWIGQGAAINPGLRIGTGSVIAAHSVVTKDVPPYAIVGGNPAKVIKMRFPEVVVGDLLQIKWWEYKFTDFGGIDLSNPYQFLRDFDVKRRTLEKYAPPKIKLADMGAL